MIILLPVFIIFGSHKKLNAYL